MQVLPLASVNFNVEREDAFKAVLSAERFFRFPICSV